MAQYPSMIIVVRHGSRLDVVDRNWHLQSPAPYDPPLTYGGWKQSHALGARIASLVQKHNEESSQAANAAHDASKTGEIDQALHQKSGAKDDRKKALSKSSRLIIHSSPYLRCLQTAIALAAGIEEAQGENRRPRSRKGHQSTSNTPYSGSPQIRGMHDPPLSSISEPLDSGYATLDTDGGTAKLLLRIDGFLGEWLSPEYFKDVTPPPDTKMMLVAAKAEMTREGDYVMADLTKANPQTNRHGQTGLWRDSVGNAEPRRIEDPNPTTRPPLIRIARSSSHSVVGDSPMSTGLRVIGHPALADTVRDGVYKQPSPTSLILSSDPIPQGYVTFARDACINFDSKWDSSRPPQLWGDGGQLGNSWPLLHTRIRNGLRKLLSWYRNPGPDRNGILPDPAQSSESKSDDTDTILIIVTHSAGCNATIHALSGQPVLLDPGTASLSMAVRRPNGMDASSARRRLSSTTGQTLGDENPLDAYDVKLVASMDHLKTKSTSTARARTGRSPSGASHSGWRSISSISAASSVGRSGALAGDDTSPLSDDLEAKLRALDMNYETPQRPKSQPGLWTRPEGSQKPGLWTPPGNQSPGTPLKSNGALSKDGEEVGSKAETTKTSVVPGPTSQNVKQQNSVSIAPKLWGQLPAKTNERKGDGSKKTIKRRWTHTTDL